MKLKNFKIINLFTGIFILLSSGFSQEVKSLDKRKYIAWTVDHMPYHILVEDAIIDYNTLNTLENPRVKKKKKKAIVLKEMLAEDLLIIVQQKKSTKNEIHEIWYGNGLNFNIIPREIVDWVLSQDIQEALIEKDQYLNSPSDVVFFEVLGVKTPAGGPTWRPLNLLFLGCCVFRGPRRTNARWGPNMAFPKLDFLVCCAFRGPGRKNARWGPKMVFP